MVGLSLLPRFKDKLIEVNLRSFVKDISSASRRNSFYLLERFQNISHLFKINQVDWTLFRYLYSSEYLQMTFTDDKLFNFQIKNLLNELLIMDNWIRRKPSLYNDSWGCPRCGNKKETNEHVWACSKASTVLE